MKHYIYKITNYANGKVYIGQTSRISKDGIIWRIQEHLKQLRANKHPIEDMQNDFNLNPNEFDWEIVEEFENENPTQKEKEWMIKTNSYMRECGYNYKDGLFGRKVMKCLNAH